MGFEIFFYMKENGESPIDDFLINLPVKMRAKAVGMISLLEEKGNLLREPYSKHLSEKKRRCRKTPGHQNNASDAK